MPKLPSAFRRKDHEGMSNRSLVPEGKYLAKIVSSEYVQNSNKNGHILKLKFEIMTKEYKGRNIFVNLNLDNKSDTAVEIANNELATILEACGKASIKDSNQIHGIPMLVDVIEVPAEGKYRPRNEISMYYPANSSDEGEDLDEDELEEDVSDSDEPEEYDDEVSVEDVVKAAKEYKSENSMKKLNKIFAEYECDELVKLKDIKKEVEKLDEDDRESLLEDLTDE